MKSAFASVPGGGEFKPGSLEHSKPASIWDIYLLGITIVIGGQMFSWNHSLQAGFWNCFAATLWMASGYLCLVLCMAELTSTMPFSGGVYGFVRIVTNPMLGFLVACCEVIQNIMYVAVVVIAIGKMVSAAVGCHENYEPLIWLVFYTCASLINLAGGNIFLRANMVLGVISLALVLAFVLISTKFGDFEKYADNHISDHNGEEIEFIRHMPLTAWFYIGIETLPFAAVYCSRPKKQVPMAMVYCMSTLFVTSIAMLFAVASQPPGIEEVSKAPFPCNFAFAKALGISPNEATWFTIIPTFATGFGFMFAYQRQMYAMAGSGMLPRWLTTKTTGSDMPYASLLLGTLLTLCVVLPIYFSYRSFYEDIFLWCSLSSYIVYTSTFISFIELRRKFSVMSRTFVNPLGIPSAVIGWIMFTVNFISAVGFQGEDQPIQHRIHPIAGFSVCMGLSVLWYFAYAQKKQCFSVEEQTLMFSAYVIKANLKGRQKLRQVKVSISVNNSSVKSGGKMATMNSKSTLATTSTHSTSSTNSRTQNTRNNDSNKLTSRDMSKTIVEEDDLEFAGGGYSPKLDAVASGSSDERSRDFGPMFRVESPREHVTDSTIRGMQALRNAITRKANNGDDDDDAAESSSYRVKSVHHTTAQAVRRSLRFSAMFQPSPSVVPVDHLVPPVSTSDDGVHRILSSGSQEELQSINSSVL